ncbi:MAG: transaminase [Candidatus Limnocylindrales bacterium]
MGREGADFEAAHPRSRALHERARASLFAGVPMNWMVKWPGAFPVYVAEAEGAHFRCVDGHDYVDLCLGDTGAMTGHAPPATVAALTAQLPRGITTMLPTEQAALAAEALQERFGMRYWQFSLTATDANRFALRLARLVTGRRYVLVFNGCYHGSVDESFAALGPTGRVEARRGSLGPPVDPALTTRVVEFNDIAALEAVLAAGDVAAVLTEPALTNMGIVLPDAGYHDALREITRRTGTVLLLDETHTLCAGPRGCIGVWGLEPDMVVVGKSIGGGVPVGAYGFSESIGMAAAARIEREDADVGGIGGTLAGNPVSTAAVTATLAALLDEADFARMSALAERWTADVEATLARYAVPWHVTRLGARAEYHFQASAPRNGGEAAATADYELERYLHLHALNRGVLLTPFHNMALMSPVTTMADVARHSDAFEAAVAELFG